MIKNTPWIICQGEFGAWRNDGSSADLDLVTRSASDRNGSQNRSAKVYHLSVNRRQTTGGFMTQDKQVLLPDTFDNNMTHSCSLIFRFHDESQAAPPSFPSRTCELGQRDFRPLRVAVHGPDGDGVAGLWVQAFNSVGEDVVVQVTGLRFAAACNHTDTHNAINALNICENATKTKLKMCVSV